MFGLPLYLRNAAPSTPMKGGLRNTIKGESTGREVREKRKKGIKSKKKKKKKKKKKIENPHAHTFSHRDPCVMTFREHKILVMLDCEE